MFFFADYFLGVGLVGINGFFLKFPISFLSSLFNFLFLLLSGFISVFYDGSGKEDFGLELNLIEISFFHLFLCCYLFGLKGGCSTLASNFVCSCSNC
jgi:hypothetical protein